MYNKRKIGLMEIALKYVEKSYSGDQLMDGDDLYGCSEEDKEMCGEFWVECRDDGISNFRKKINKLKA